MSIYLSGVNLLTDGGPAFSGNETTINNTYIGGPASLFNLLRDYINHTAAYNSFERQSEHASICMEGTRERVLADVNGWVRSGYSNPLVCWLHGFAGTGKSTIAHTIAKQCDGERRLSFSYFFSRRNPGRSDMTKLFTTFAFQFACALPGLQKAMPDASNPDSHQRIIAIPHRSLEEQLEELVLSPLARFQSMSQTTFPQPMIVVIDGLDEYDPHIGRVSLEHLVQLLVYASHKAPFRLLLTSRPEAHIRDIFDTIRTPLRHLALQDFPAFDDVFNYLYREMAAIREKRKLPQSWPSKEDLCLIAKQSEGIFVYASTLVNFVNDEKKDPIRMLQIAMNANNGLDSLFEQVLHHAEEYDNFGLVLGAVVFLRNNPHINLLPPLLRLDSVRNVRDALRGCLSILLVPERDDDYIRPYHASLLDFLSDPARRRHRFFDHVAFNKGIVDSCIEIIMADSSSNEMLLGYTHRNWIHHFSLVLSFTDCDPVEDLAVKVGEMVKYLVQELKTWMCNLGDIYGVRLLYEDLVSTLESIKVRSEHTI